MPEPILTYASSADLAAAVEANLFALFRTIAGSLPGATIVEGEKVSYHYTTEENSMFKAAWNIRLEPHEVESVIDQTIAWFKAQGAPYFYWFTGCSTTPADLSRYLVARGMQGYTTQSANASTSAEALYGGAPGMAITLNEISDTLLTSVPAGFTIEEVQNEAALMDFKQVFIESYPGRESAADAWVNGTLKIGIGRTPWKLYLGRRNGAPVAINMMLLGGGVAGLYLVGTSPAARGQGIGAAITVKPLLDARVMGYHYGVLFASSMGVPVYQRIGFQIVDTRINRYLCQIDLSGIE